MVGIPRSLSLAPGRGRRARPARRRLTLALFLARQESRRNYRADASGPLSLQAIVALREQEHERLRKPSVASLRLGAPTIHISVPELRLTGLNQRADAAIDFDGSCDPLGRKILEQGLEGSLDRAEGLHLM